MRLLSLSFHCNHIIREKESCDTLRHHILTAEALKTDSSCTTSLRIWIVSDSPPIDLDNDWITGGREGVIVRLKLSGLPRDYHTVSLLPDSASGNQITISIVPEEMLGKF
jgi:hypothetical protein